MNPSTLSTKQLNAIILAAQEDIAARKAKQNDNNSLLNFNRLQGQIYNRIATIRQCEEQLKNKNK